MAKSNGSQLDANEVGVFTAPNDPVLRAKVAGDDFERIRIEADGTILTGDGSADPATDLSAGSGASVTTDRMVLRLMAWPAPIGNNQVIDFTGATVVENVGTSLSVVAGVPTILADGDYTATLSVQFGDLTGATYTAVKLNDDASHAQPSEDSGATDAVIGAIRTTTFSYYLPTDDGGSPNFFDCRISHDAAAPSECLVRLTVQRHS